MKIKSKKLNRFSIFVFLNNMLDTFVRTEDTADRTIVIQSINQKSDVFAEVAVDVVRSAQQFRCLVN